jgi:hypothetical protein
VILRCVYVLLLAATIFFRPDGRGIESPGIIALELSPLETLSNVIIGGWSDAGVKAAIRLQEQDDPWIPVYSATLALGCYLASTGKWGKRWMYGSILAGVCDLIENRAINRMLAGETVQPWPAVSSTFATIKFVLVIAAVIYTLRGFVIWMKRVRTNRVL